MTGALARHAIKRRAGMRMFQAVIVFGAATVVFAVSHLMWLSILSLVVLGAAPPLKAIPNWFSRSMVRSMITASMKTWRRGWSS